MKTVINLVLAACVVGLVYICYGSIMGPIEFDKEKAIREKAIIERLINIRKAQMEYRTMHKGAYTKSFDTLIAFVKTAKLPFVKKEGALTDAQLESGMTEKKAMEIINKDKKTNKWDEVKKEGLETYVYRQTSVGKISEYSFSTYVDLIYNDNSLTDAQKREKWAFLMNINEVKNVDSSNNQSF